MGRSSSTTFALEVVDSHPGTLSAGKEEKVVKAAKAKSRESRAAGRRGVSSSPRRNGNGVSNCCYLSSGSRGA